MGLTNGATAEDHSAEMRRCLIALDVEGIRRLWKHVAPNMPQPESDNEALISMHMSRTAAEFVPFKLRAYSHAFLRDNGFPSQLPDHLRPNAEQLCPRIVDAVGYAPKFRSPLLKPIKPHVVKAVADAIEDCYAENKTEPHFVSQRMHEAKEKVIKQLMGNVESLKKP